MGRAHVKNAAACAISWTGLARLTRATPLVVCYHRVVEQLDTNKMALPAMEISAATLERHIDWLGKHFNIVSLDELHTAAPGRPIAAITFDDGYSDVYHHAFPLLKRKGIPAAIFVVTDLIGSKQPPMHERLHALLVGAVPDPFATTRHLLGTLPYADVQRIMDTLQDIAALDDGWQETLRPMTWEMLAEMRDAGMTIGSHSKTHAFLNNEDLERVREETAASRNELEHRLGTDVRYFAYPGGSFNRTVVDAVAAAGYKSAFTICRHQDREHPSLTVPRVGMWERSCLDPAGNFSPAIMNCQAAGAFRWTSPCREVHTN